MTRRLLRIGMLAVALLIVSGCDSSGPEEQYTAAAKAADKKDLKGYASFFTARSKQVLKGMADVKSRAKLDYLDDVFKLLPKGDVSEVVINDLGTYALLTVKDGKKTTKVRMLFEEGLWLIDGFALEDFWEPITKDNS